MTPQHVTCPTCGYQLAVPETTVCTECGHAIDRGPSRRRLIVVALPGLLAGLLFTPIALLLSLISAGAGHGHYVAARALYPIPMSIAIATEHIGAPSLGLALLQYPAYGALIGLAIGARRRWLLIAAISAALHLLATYFCFFGSSQQFA